jgi:hypothetical protein
MASLKKRVKSSLKWGPRTWIKEKLRLYIKHSTFVSWILILDMWDNLLIQFPNVSGKKSKSQMRQVHNRGPRLCIKFDPPTQYIHNTKTRIECSITNDLLLPYIVIKYEHKWLTQKQISRITVQATTKKTRHPITKLGNLSQNLQNTSFYNATQ